MLPPVGVNANPWLTWRPMNDGFAPAGDHWLYYQENGSGEPVIFLHAGVADSRMWLAQLEAVPEGHRFIAYDQRGFGKTKVGDESGRPHRDVLAILDYFSIDEAVIVGCSMGGGIAIDLALENPDRVKALGLVGAGSPGFEPEGGHYEPPQWPKAVEAFKAGDLERVAELDYEMWMIGHGRDAADMDHSLKDLFLAMDLTALQSEAKRDGLTEPGPDRASGFRGLSKPIRAIVGEYDLPDVVAAAHDIAKKKSGETAVVIPDSAHLPSIQNPEAFNDAIFRFLDSV
jgi:pimeloyl-ACP methyl ester carboxylesterase